MGPPLLTYSWIGLTAITPLVAMLITWTLISIHKKRLKSILLLAIIYTQLFFQILNFSHSTLSLLKLDLTYIYYLNYIFNILIIFKSLNVISLHLEEFYKLKSPSNYILNINSSLLKYHLIVVLLISCMGGYFLKSIEFIPIIFATDLFIVIIFISFHIIIILVSIILVISKCLIKNNNTRLDIIHGSSGSSGGGGGGGGIGTNSTSSSANLFGVVDGCRGNAHGTASSAVAAINLTINVSLVVCTFSPYWLPSNWPLSNILTWSQLFESIVTPSIYWLAYAKNHQNHQGRMNGCSSNGSGRYGYDYDHHHPRFPITNGSLCFNNGEFKYFAGGKNGSAMVLNNASSEYNTLDSFHQTRSYSKDSLRCASVTTIANDDFEFLSRAPPPPLPLPLPLSRPPSTSQLHQQQQSPVHLLRVPVSIPLPYNNHHQYHQHTHHLDDYNNIIEQDMRLMSRGGHHHGIGFINNNNNNNINNLTSMNSNRRGIVDTTVGSLSMNDLDLIECNSNHDIENNRCKYKKNSNRIKRRFMSNSAHNHNNIHIHNNNNHNNTNGSGGMNRRVLSLESLHSNHHVNESHLAYLDTGERVIVFTTDFL